MITIIKWADACHSNNVFATIVLNYKIRPMKYIHSPKDVLHKIEKERTFKIKLTREEAKFQGIEKYFSDSDLSSYFSLPAVLTNDFIFYLTHQNPEFVFIDFVDKIRLLTNLKNGKILYKKLDIQGDVWQAWIIFKRVNRSSN